MLEILKVNPEIKQVKRKEILKNTSDADISIELAKEFLQTSLENKKKNF